MEDAQAWRAWNAWRYVMHAVAEIAPEVLEDLARLVPLYQEARPHMRGPYWSAFDWESLEEAIKILGILEGPEEPLTKLRSLREGLLSWGRRWNLAHPEPLNFAIQNLGGWAQAPEVAGKPVFYMSPPVDFFSPPPFRPPELPLPIHGSENSNWANVEQKLREAFEAWLQGCRSRYEEWALRKPELLKHARWWVAHRVKKWSIRTLHDRAREEGLVRRGRVLIEKASPATISEAISRLDRELNYPAQELSPPAP
ncbi:hypothetical protein [Fervidobacterium sp.]